MQSRLLSMLFIVAALPASALSAEPARYQIVPVSGGFVRLDTLSGAMTLCREDVDQLRCEPVDAPAETAQSRALPRPTEVQPKKESSVEDFDQALTMMEKAMRRFMAITQEKPRECAL